MIRPAGINAGVDLAIAIVEQDYGAATAARIERARALIEAGASSLDEVARNCGFETAERMRRSLVRSLGQTPRELRRIGNR